MRLAVRGAFFQNVFAVSSPQYVFRHGFMQFKVQKSKFKKEEERHKREERRKKKKQKISSFFTLHS
jgi:hypothetical protein